MAKVLKRGGASLVCPECGEHNVELYEDNKEYITKRKGILGRKAKTEVRQKKKLSAAKLGLGLMTGGASLLVTGTKSKVKRQWYCKSCGCVFEE